MYFMKNRRTNSIKNKDIVNVKVKETIDLTSPLLEINSIRNKMINEGQKLEVEMTHKDEFLDKKLKQKQKEISLLKDSFDKIIQKTNKINNELNRKKDFSTQEKVNLESNKLEIEKKLSNLSKSAKEIENLLSGKTEEFKNYINEVLSVYKRLTDRNELSKTVSQLVNMLIIKKLNAGKSHIQTSNLKKIEKKSSSDAKILSNIDKDIKKINDGLTSSFKNTTTSISNLRKISLDERNIKNLEFEKQQHNDEYQRLQKNIKELLEKNEVLQNQIKDLEKNKNKLRENLNTKEVENKILNDKLKNEIKNLRKDIVKEEKNLLHIANTHKEILKEKEIRIKNLVLILNKLLIKYKLSKRKTNASAADLLNSILFDKKTVDLNSDDINEKIIEEISGQITK